MSPILESVLARLGDATARITLLLLLVLVAALLLRRAAAVLRHRLWAGALVLVLVMPLASLLLPTLGLPVLKAPAPPEPPPPALLLLPRSYNNERATSIRGLVNAVALAGRFEGGSAIMRLDLPPPPRPRGTLAAPAGHVLVSLLLALWLAGVVVAGGRTLRARRASQRLLVGSRPADGTVWPGLAGIRARESETIELPMTVGALRPVVLLPHGGRQWPEDWRRAAVVHEVAHVRQRDPLLQLLAELLTALYWFHPLVHLAARQLRIERELNADDQVLVAGHRSSQYAQLLVTLACAPDTPPTAGAVVPLLTPAGLKARLLGILDGSRPRLVRRLPAVLLATAAALAVAPLAAAIPVRPPGQVTSGPIIAHVRDQAGRPVAGAEVDFVMRDGTLRVSSAADGSVRRPVPPRDPYDTQDVLYARAGGQATRKIVRRGPYGTTLPVDVTLRPAPTLRGTVRSPGGRPVPDAELHIIRWSAHSVGPGGGVLATTDRDGAFAVSGLLYGSYTLLAVAPDGATSSASIKVAADDPRPVDLTVGERRLTGWLKDEQGRPLADVFVERLPRFYDGSSQPAPAARHAEWDVTGGDGSYRMLPLGGTLFARAQDRHGHSIEALFSDGGAPHWFGQHGMQQVGPRPAEVILARPAVVSVAVRWSDGTAAARADIRLRSPALAAAGGPLGPHYTDGQGRLEPVAVPPGTLLLEAREFQLNPDGSWPGQSVNLTLAPGERRHVELVLPRQAPVP